MVTRIERPRGRICVLLLGLAFLGVFLILIGIGAEAPPVLVRLGSESRSSLSYDAEKELNIYSATFSLSPENQVFWLDLQLSTGEEGILSELEEADGDTIKIDVEIAFEVLTTEYELIEKFDTTVTQTCPIYGEWCDLFFVWRGDFIEHDEYMVEMSLPDPAEYIEISGHRGDSSDPLFDINPRVTAINPSFTRFEIGWKYTWLIATLLVMYCPCGIGFLSALQKRYRDTGHRRTYHQRWTAVLLWGLVWFNDPFIALTVYTNWAKFFSAVFILSASIFVYFILLFWLCLLTDVRYMQRGIDDVHRGICYWVPKVVLTAAIAITIFSGYMYYRFEDTVDPVYTGVDDEKKRAEALAGLLGMMMAIYALWMLLLILRAICKLRSTSASHIMLFVLTLITCLVAMVGVFVAAYYPYSTSGEAFLGIHGVLNLYVWTLAACFTPVAPGSDSVDKPPGEMAAVVVGTGDDPDIVPWTDSEFKAVEL